MNIPVNVQILILRFFLIVLITGIMILAMLIINVILGKLRKNGNSKV